MFENGCAGQCHHQLENSDTGLLCAPVGFKYCRCSCHGVQTDSWFFRLSALGMSRLGGAGKMKAIVTHINHTGDEEPGV